MQPISNAVSVKRPSQCQLGLGILSSNARHHPRTSGLINYIDHGTKPVISSGR